MALPSNWMLNAARKIHEQSALASEGKRGPLLSVETANIIAAHFCAISGQYEDSPCHHSSCQQWAGRKADSSSRESNENQSKLIKPTEHEPCPECDGTCFVSKGLHGEACLHCWLAEADERESQKVKELREALEKVLGHLKYYVAGVRCMCSTKGKCSAHTTIDEVETALRNARSGEAKS